jgi:hypothetical protein
VSFLLETIKSNSETRKKAARIQEGKHGRKTKTERLKEKTQESNAAPFESRCMDFTTVRKEDEICSRVVEEIQR